MMKKLISSIMLVSLLTMAPKEADARGPFEDYLDCAEVCIEKYEPWTLRLSACAADCYVELIAAPVTLVVEAL